MYFEKLDNFYLFRLVVEKFAFNCHPVFLYCYHWFHIQVRDLNTFFIEKNTSKVGIIQRRKTRLWKIFKIKKFLLGVLWHCNDVVYPLNGRYFFKKLFPVSKHQVRDNLQFQQNPWNKRTLNHLAKWMDECSFPN